MRRFLTLLSAPSTSDSGSIAGYFLQCDVAFDGSLIPDGFVKLEEGDVEVQLH